MTLKTLGLAALLASVVHTEEPPAKARRAKKKPKA